MAYIVDRQEPIAIVGASCRFAGDATSPLKLWDLLCKPFDLSREVPPERFSAKGFYHKDGEYHGTTNCIKAYWLNEDCRAFDPGFFNITPKEAEAMDPQQRLLLEVVFEAMESAGFPLSQYSGKRVGVFAGCMTQDYEVLSSRDELTTSQYFATGNSRAMLSNRISYFFNFQGPSMTIDTACSSSLVALHQAVLSLREGDCSMACVAGANMMLTPEQFIVESALHMLSPSGKCHMWDTRADGYARGEGFAVLLVKRLSHAIRDGDKIEAVIRATGSNADGRTAGITIPNPQAQAALIRSTYKKAGLDPKNPSDRCQYFEAHGTGTKAGDPREAAAIHEAFFGNSEPKSKAVQSSHNPEQKMLVGSIKTVVGHTEAAAGLAGVLKIVWSINHGLVPPNLHFEHLNPEVKPFYTHLQIPTVLTPWPDPPPGQPRRASVNSFGFGGANAHAIIESYIPEVRPVVLATPLELAAIGCCPEQATTRVLAPQPQLSASASPDPFHLPLVISAASHKSLRDLVQSYRKYLDENDVDVHHLSWHQFSRCTGLPYQVAFSAATRPDALRALDSLLPSNGSAIPPERISRSQVSDAPLRILGIFTGQGAQWATMSRTLLQQNSVYRNTIRKLDGVLTFCPQPPSWTLEDHIMADKDESCIDEAAVSQPVCTALQIALVDFLRSIGIDFHTVVGHSSGEIAAAYAAGRISAKDAILISYHRGMVAHLARGADGQKGAMSVARMSEREATSLCRRFAGRICVAASNSPNSVTLSGDIECIRLAHDQLKENRTASKILQIDTGYHSHHMHQPAEQYTVALSENNISSSPKGNGIVWISSVKGRSRITQDLDIGYWADNMVNQVEFTQAVKYALSQSGSGFDCAIEIGPHPALQSSVSETAKPLGRTILYTSPLNRTKDSSVSVSNFLEFIWSNFGSSKVALGTYIEQSPVPDVVNSRLTDIPSYPFDHSASYWRESRISRQYHHKTEVPHELLGVRCREDNIYEMKWRNILKIEKLPWLGHHQFQGQALLPASAYCIMALDAARAFLAGRPASLVELRDIEILSGIALDRDSAGVETLFTLTMSDGDKELSNLNGTFSLYSCSPDGATKMKKDATGSLHIVLGEPSLEVLPLRQPSLSETSAADAEVFYETMNKATGLLYTGPFRALDTIHRRYRYCCATLGRFHSDDTTKLGISPATLDACFQTAFLAYAYPGDGSFWTSFLPTGIRRIKFNLATLANADPKGSLTVDTNMVRCMPPTEASRASIAIDSAIFNNAGEAEIHVEDLVVRALADTNPKDDYELYLHTVMDIDPADEIVPPDDAVSAEDSNLLAENCRRITSFILDYHVAENSPKATKGSLVETQEAIDTMIRNSHHSDYLAHIKEAGQLDVIRLSEALPSILKEARQVSLFRNHLGRIVKQVVHRYPWMNILYMPTKQFDLTRIILDTIGGSYQSFTLGVSGGTPSSASPRLGTQPSESFQELDINTLGQPGTQIGSEVLLDLVILPTTLLGYDDMTKALEGISRAMKQGGFLILINPNVAILNTQPGTRSGDGTNRPPTPPEWPDILDAYGFTRQARNSDHYHRAGYVLVRQLGERRSFKFPVQVDGSTTVTENLLFLRSASGKDDSQLVAGLQGRISPHCSHVTSRSLYEVTTQELEDCTAVIVLADLSEPVMSNMTQHTISQFQILFRPAMTVLWVTCDARSGNPEAAASFGFLRTMVAEVPNLKLQVLDLDPNDVESPVDRISSAFYQLVFSKKDISNKSMWTLEHEIHMENGRRLIPRVMPWTQANDRVNALRRMVTVPVNTIQQYIELAPKVLPNDTICFSLNHIEQSPRQHLPPGSAMIRVDYSSALPLKLYNDISRYVCVGHNCYTGKRVIALSNTNSSYIASPPSIAMTLEGDKHQSLTVLHELIRCITALTSVSIVSPDHPIVLIDPDVEFANQLIALASESHKVIIVGTCCNEHDKARYTKILECDKLRRYVSVCLHPQCLLGDLKHAFPQRGTIFNFLPDDHQLTRRIMASISNECAIYTGFTTFVLKALLHNEDLPVLSFAWNMALRSVARRSLENAQEPRESDLITTVSLRELQSRAMSAQSFQIVDWNRDSHVLRSINHTVDGPLVSSNKTYYLFGMTRDFGHSICRLLLEQGARSIVLASRNPDTSLNWVTELNAIYAADIRIKRADVTNIESLHALKKDTAKTMPPAGGVVNGAMVLDDCLFAQMTIETWNRVLHPKTIGSANLDTVFSEPDLDFFIMTSSFAAIGGHAGQSNYAAANMYMNGLAAQRRKRGLVGMALNIGVIYGLGLLQREKTYLYAGLEKDGYPPISERDLHHMFLEAVVAGRPTTDGDCAKYHQEHVPFDITTGLRRFRRGSPQPLHWHEDLRFGHFAMRPEADSANVDSTNNTKRSLQEELACLSHNEAVANAISAALEQRLRALMQLPDSMAIDMHSSPMDLGLDSLTAVEVRTWFNKSLGQDFAVMKIINATSILQLCNDCAEHILALRADKNKA
ncbi:hypothetical protein F5B22DRAFT_647032 [Xylaria bambusicola]|uniref:uncharacterized protein n=1 Tax=Xylaria bambusicola TaxID=326684 RepID=UPI002008AD02|nr:uncharacterized protein F5B22DRAFT_647032 [Xylaria bambusicola]KAI0515152.1 hypothetical protein F5B22DRAFT_647032 [Xylaria bambusicola]